MKSVAKRNENYFKAQKAPGSLRYFGISDDNARLNALLSGDVHIAAAITAADAAPRQSNPDPALETTSGNYTNLNAPRRWTPAPRPASSRA